MDVAAGAVLVMEAGGAVLLGNKGGRLWEPVKTLGPSWGVVRPISDRFAIGRGRL